MKLWSAPGKGRGRKNWAVGGGIHSQKKKGKYFWKTKKRKERD